MGGLAGGAEPGDRELVDERADERAARALLMRIAEGGDPRRGARVQRLGAVRVAEEILAGSSPLAGAPAMRERILAGCRDIASAAAADLAAGVRCGARLVIPGDPDWPTQLADLGPREPLGLWVRGAGSLRLLALRSIAVVGARAATGYGEALARTLGAELAAQGWLVVSGGAFGIDAAAHRGALAAEGATGCVLACGVDVPYPRSHDALLSRIADNGVLLSEASPGAAALRSRFLTRNRIIAALTRGTVVVEAALRSGSATTAREAIEINRPVMAFPGPVTSPMSAGCHHLVREGRAVLVTGTDEVVELVDGLARAARGEDGTWESPRGDPGDGAEDPRAGRILGAFPSGGPAPLEVLSRGAGLSPTDALVALGILEARGLVRRCDRGWSRAA